MQTDDSLLLGEVIDGRYQIRSRLGAGGVGMVYLAERLEVGRMVAIKFLHKTRANEADFVDRFKREALAMSRLYHVHCVSLIDHGMHGDRPYLVMEYVPGVTLSDALQSGRMPPRRAIHIMLQILGALGYFHRHDIVHRDIKTENIMLLDTPESRDFVKLLDFGMAKLLAGAGSDIMVSVKGTIVGTPTTMSPEQIREMQIDGRSDLYSAGIMLYQMVVGKKPFWATSALEIMKAHLGKPPVPPSVELGPGVISQALEAVILRALEKDRNKRFQSAGEMADALMATPEAQGLRPETQGAHADPGAAARSLRFWAVLGWVLLGVVIVGMSVFAALSDDEGKPADGAAGARLEPGDKAAEQEPLDPDLDPDLDLEPGGGGERDKGGAAGRAQAEGGERGLAADAPAEDGREVMEDLAPWREQRARAAGLAAQGSYHAAMTEVRAILRAFPEARGDRALIDVVIATLALPAGDKAFIPEIVREFGQEPAAQEALLQAMTQGADWYVRHHAWVALQKMGKAALADEVGMWLADFREAETCRMIQRSYRRLVMIEDARAKAELDALVDRARRGETDRYTECLAAELRAR